MSRLIIVLGVLLLCASSADAQRPAFETVPLGVVKQAEQAVRQARAAWTAASRNLEGDLLTKDPDEMRKRVAQSRGAKLIELTRLGALFRTLADQMPSAEDWLHTGRDMSPDASRVAGDVLARREAALLDEINRRAKARTIEEITARENLTVQLDQVRQLGATLEAQRAAHDDLRQLDADRERLDREVLDATQSLRGRLLGLADGVEREGALWEYYFDTLEDAVERNRAERPSKSTRPPATSGRQP